MSCEKTAKRISTVLLSMLLVSSASAQTITPSDLTYVGSFELPSVPHNPPNVNFVGRERGMSHRADGDPTNTDAFPGSLILVGTRAGDQVRLVAEVSIPEPTTERPFPTATILQPFTDITEGRQGGYSFLGDAQFLSAQGAQTEDKIYWTLYSWYNPPELYTHVNGPLGWSETDLTNSAGMWRLDGLSCRIYGKYLFELPSAWANDHAAGRLLATGYARTGGGFVLGPSLFTFAPWQEGNPPPDAEDGSPPDGNGNADPAPIHTLPKTVLLQYAGTNSPDYPDTLRSAAPNDIWNDGAWLELGTKSAVVFLGRKAHRTWTSGKWQYPSATVHESQGSNSSGYHSWPHAPVLYFYDPQDLEQVAAGSQQPHEPQPFVRMELMPYFIADRSPGGLGYDRTNNLLYIEENAGTTATLRVVHVFRLADSGRPLDTSPPDAFELTLDQVTKEEVALSWTVPRDDSEKDLTYRLLQNERIFAITKENAFVDRYSEYYTTPLTYVVRAVDEAGNWTDSNPVRVSAANGGNEPFAIFTPACNVSAESEVSSLPIASPGVPFSFTPDLQGGTAPFTWSVAVGSLPTGMTLEPTDGTIAGTLSGSTGSTYFTLEVSDAKGNLTRRKTHWSLRADSADLDRDGDGTTTVEGDLDDMDWNVATTTIGLQPPPTNLKIKTYTATTVTLMWSAAIDRSDLSWSLIGETTYLVHHGTTPDLRSVFVGPATSYTLEWSSEESDYYFAVSALDFRGLASEKTAILHAKPPATDCGCNTDPPIKVPERKVPEEESCSCTSIRHEGFSWSIRHLLALIGRTARPSISARWIRSSRVENSSAFQ